MTTSALTGPLGRSHLRIAMTKSWWLLTPTQIPIMKPEKGLNVMTTIYSNDIIQAAEKSPCPGSVPHRLDVAPDGLNLRCGLLGHWLFSPACWTGVGVLNRTGLAELYVYILLRLYIAIWCWSTSKCPTPPHHKLFVVAFVYGSFKIYININSLEVPH